MKIIDKSKVSIGFWCQFFDYFAIKKVCSLNYDWIALDMEHGIYDINSISQLVNLIKSSDKISFVRLKESSVIEIQKTLDCGAEGLILPMVECPDLLEKLISKTKYPPFGTRSVGFSNSNTFGLSLSKDLKSKFRPFLVIQIESVKAVDNLEYLINQEGVDAIMVGPYDLSASLGCPGEFNNKKFIDTIDRINKIIVKNSVLNGYHIVEPDISQLQEKIKSGYKFIAFGTDGSFIQSKLNIS